MRQLSRRSRDSEFRRHGTAAPRDHGRPAGGLQLHRGGRDGPWLACWSRGSRDNLHLALHDLSLHSADCGPPQPSPGAGPLSHWPRRLPRACWAAARFYGEASCGRPRPGDRSPHGPCRRKDPAPPPQVLLRPLGFGWIGCRPQDPCCPRGALPASTSGPINLAKRTFPADRHLPAPPGRRTQGPFGAGPFVHRSLRLPRAAWDPPSMGDHRRCLGGHGHPVRSR